MLAEVLYSLATIPAAGVAAVLRAPARHPGDPAVIIAGDYATTDDIARIRTKLGPPALPHPGGDLAGPRGARRSGHLDLLGAAGLHAHRPARGYPAIWLTLFAMLISVGVGVPIGVVAAWRKGSWLDRAVMVFAVSGFSMPTFWLGFILVYVFAITAGWLPVQGYAPLTGGGLVPQPLILPALTLSVVYMALIARMTRASMLGVLDEDYIRTASARAWRRAGAGAPRPQERLAADRDDDRPRLRAAHRRRRRDRERLGAASWAGPHTVDAIARDYPVIQGVLLVVSGAYVMINPAVDVLYVVLDPRIRY